MPKRQVKPITPAQVVQKKGRIFPSQVFEAFNELIARECDDGYCKITQDDVVALMVKKGLKKKDIFINNWLDVEGAYRAAGWRVEYDKPGFNEAYDAYFEFTKKRSSR